MIVQRFLADRASDLLVAVLSPEHDDLAITVVAFVRLRKDKDTLIEHTEDPENAKDRGQLDILFAAFEARDCGRAYLGERG